jgi:PAS domain S-box-containing protein
VKVLYVEDNPLDIDLTRRELQKNAPQIVLDVVPSYREAMGRLRNNPDYDLMLTDLRLPDGGGFALLSFVRERDLPMAVVVITGQGDEDTAVAVMKAGADSFIVKRQNYLDQLALTLEGVFKSYQEEIARRPRLLRVLYMDQTFVENEQTRRLFASHAQHIQLEVVFTVPELIQRLFEKNAVAELDVLLLDYRLDTVEGLELLKELRQVRRIDLPIVLVTSHGDQEVAAQALRLGASDYVVKTEGYLYRLPGLLENAYHHAQLLREQAALRASEERFRSLIENSADGIIVTDGEFAIKYASPSCSRVLGYQQSSLLGEKIPDYTAPQDLPGLQQLSSQMRQQPGKPFQTEFRVRDSLGEWRWLQATCVNLIQESAVEGIIFNFRDITERYLAEERIHRQLQRLQALREVDIAITSGLALRQILDLILQHVISQLGVHAADILLYEPETQELYFGVEKGFLHRTNIHTRVSLGQDYAGRAALERRTIHLFDIADPQAPIPQAFLEEYLQRESFQAYIATPLIAKHEIKGVLEIAHRAPLSPDGDWLNFLETLAGQAAIAIDNDLLVEGLVRTNTQLELAYDQTLQGWVRLLDLRDMETGDHTQRLIRMTEKLAQRLGVRTEDLDFILRGALLHDIGKIGVPDSILRKPGPLTEEEWDKMRLHSQIAYEMLSRVDYLRPALDIPYCHHEKWDGTGYPRGLKGEEIPLAARIFAVVDVYDALSNDRHYRQAWGREQILEHIAFLSGSHFDPWIVEVFMEMVKENQL